MIYNLAEKEYSIHFIPNLEKAINIYKLIPEWRDSNQKILLCEDEIKKIKENYEIRSKKGKKDLYIALIAVVVIIILALLFS